MQGSPLSLRETIPAVYAKLHGTRIESATHRTCCTGHFLCLDILVYRRLDLELLFPHRRYLNRLFAVWAVEELTYGVR